MGTAQPEATEPEVKVFSDRPERVSVRVRVHLKTEDQDEFIEEFSENVSRTGMFIATQSPQAPGTRIHFEYRLKNDTRILRGVGVVRWVRTESGEGGPAGMGVQLIDLDENTEKLIMLMVARFGEGSRAPRLRTASRPTSPASASPPPPPINVNLDDDDERALSLLDEGALGGGASDAGPTAVSVPIPVPDTPDDAAPGAWRLDFSGAEAAFKGGEGLGPTQPWVGPEAETPLDGLLWRLGPLRHHAFDASDWQLEGLEIDGLGEIVQTDGTRTPVRDVLEETLSELVGQISLEHDEEPDVAEVLLPPYVPGILRTTIEEVLTFQGFTDVQFRLGAHTHWIDCGGMPPGLVFEWTPAGGAVSLLNPGGQWCASACALSDEPDEWVWTAQGLLVQHNIEPDDIEGCVLIAPPEVRDSLEDHVRKAYGSAEVLRPHQEE